MAWTKLKMATLATVGIVLAAGTTTIVASKTLSKPDREDARLWELNSQTLDNLPPMLILRPTKFPDAGGAVHSAKNRAVGLNASFQEMLMGAYNVAGTRMVVPTDLPKGRFDYLTTVPRADEALQNEIEKQFGIKAHVEEREVDVLALKLVNPKAPGLQPGDGKGSRMHATQSELIWNNSRFDSVARNVERFFGMPVVDKTGSTTRYNMIVRHNGSGKDEIQRALLEQLGLEFVPAREKISLLIVEKKQ